MHASTKESNGDSNYRNYADKKKITETINIFLV